MALECKCTDVAEYPKPLIKALASKIEGAVSWPFPSFHSTITMAGKMPAGAEEEGVGMPNFDFSALQNVLNVSAVRPWRQPRLRPALLY
jgi:hypothetical protein